MYSLPTNHHQSICVHHGHSVGPGSGGHPGSLLMILIMSGVVMILTHLSESRWETGGDQALERVELVSLLLFLGNLSQFASLSFYFRSLHQDYALCHINYRIQVDRRSSKCSSSSPESGSV